MLKLKKIIAAAVAVSITAAALPSALADTDSVWNIPTIETVLTESTAVPSETSFPAATVIPAEEPENQSIDTTTAPAATDIPCIEATEEPTNTVVEETTEPITAEPTISPAEIEAATAPNTEEPLYEMNQIAMFAASSATSGVCGDNLTWTLEDNILTISGTGDMYDYSGTNDVPWRDSKNSQTSGVYSIVIKDGVTSIGDYAFCDCRYVNSVTIPDSVKDIGKFSLSNLGGSSHKVGTNDDIYFTIDIGNGVETIEDYAFFRNLYITDINLGENVKYIGNSAFNDCICIKNMYIPQSVTTIGNAAFKVCTILSDIYIYNYENSISGAPWGATEATIHWLGELKIESIPTQYTYGNAVTPEVVIYNVNSDNGTKTKLVKDVDYTVSYENNTTSGTGTANISYMGNYASYSGSATSATFNIVNYDPMSIAAIGTQYYTGGAVKPQITINYNDTVLGVSNTLVEGKDYTVSYSNNNAVGTGKVTVKYLGKYANYNGSATSASFTIKAFDPTKAPTGPISISSVNFEVPDCTYYWGNPEWGGNSIRPEIRATYSYTVNGTRYSYPLTENKDYTVTYENNESAGTALANIVGMGEFTGEANYYYTIYSMTLPSSTNDSGYNPAVNVTFPNGNKYTGKNFEGEKDLKLNYITLHGLDDYPKNLYNCLGDSYEGEEDCYDVSWPDNVVNAGVYSYSIYGGGNFTGTMKGSFTIEPRGISETSISVSGCEYEGTLAYPVISITYNGMKLVNGKDYTVDISNNDAAGTGKATITGIGNYTGTVEKSFAIAACSMSAVSISSIESQRYTGSAISPDVTVTYNGRTLIKGTDYTVSYSNNINVGTATATITGKGNFSGTVSTNFKITGIDISGATVTFPENIIYQGEPCEPEPTIVVNGRTLVKGTDYTVSYSNNINVGTGKATITGTGNYTGTLTVEFEIKPYNPKDNDNPIDMSLVNISSVEDCTYNGKAHTPKPTVTYNVTNDYVYTLVEGTDYTISYENNTNAGTAKIVLTGIRQGEGGFKSTKNVYFNITSCELSATTIADIPSYEYCKEDICPEPEIKIDDVVLTKDVDYTLSYENNRNRGTATVTITGKGNLSGTVTKNFEITPRDGSRFTYYIIWF